MMDKISLLEEELKVKDETVSQLEANIKSLNTVSLQ
jgi:hypothetical protein